MYRRRGADSVIARVEGPGPNRSTRGFDIPMRRVDCTATLPASAQISDGRRRANQIPPKSPTISSISFSRIILPQYKRKPGEMNRGGR